MSRFSNNHHLNAPFQKVLDALVSYCWGQRETLEVEEFAPRDPVSERESSLNYWEERRFAIMGDTAGWTQIWTTWGSYDEELMEQLAQDLGCDALYGHNNDSVANWRWIRFQAGLRTQEFWYLDQPQYASWRAGRGMLPQPHLYEAYREWGREYAHESYASALMLLRKRGEGGAVIWTRQTNFSR